MKIVSGKHTFHFYNNIHHGSMSQSLSFSFSFSQWDNANIDGTAECEGVI